MNPYQRLDAAREAGTEATLSPSDVQLLLAIAGEEIESACKKFEDSTQLVLDHWTNTISS